jgi:hypothetical protein
MMAWDPTPVTSAIGGLRTLLARDDWQASTHAPAIRAALQRWLADSEAPNRLLVAQALNLIEPTDDGRLRLARDRLLAEAHPMVRAFLLQQLSYLIPRRAAEVDQLLAELGRGGNWPLFAVDALPDAAPPSEGTDETLTEPELLRVAVQLLLLLALHYRQPFAADLVGRWFAHPLDYPQVFPHATFELRNLGMLDPSKPEDLAARAFTLLEQATEQLVASGEERSSATQQELEVLRTAIRLTDNVVDQLYFASGALDAERARRSGDDPQPRPSRDSDSAFYELSIPLLERLANVHHPRITHDLVQTLAHLAEHDPKRVFLAVHTALAPGHGYEYEPMAVDLVIELIRRYLADYRSVVTSDEACLTALREILEAFVRVGWPSAVVLAYQLPDAFR